MKILKKLLLVQNIENKFHLILAAICALQPGIVFKKRKRFTLPLLKPVVFTFALAVVGLFFSVKAYAANPKKVNTVAYGTQTGALTYGTSASATYTITLTENGASAPALDNIVLTWTGGTPSGVTWTFTSATENPIANGTTTTPTFTPSGNNSTITFKITTSASTPASSYAFSIQITDNNGGVTGAAGLSSGLTLVVGKKALTVTATGPTKTFGTALNIGPSSTNFTATGTAPGETVTSVTLTPDANGLSSTTPVGTAYVVTPSAPTGTGGFLASNYNITFNNYNGTVAKALLTITANNQTKTYGSVFTFAGTEFSATGLTGSDAINSVTLTSAGSAATATVAGGPYSIVPSAAVGNASFSASNYTITYVNGSMTIGTLAITVSGLTVSDKSYDGTTTGSLSGGTLSGVLPADAANVTLVPSGTFSTSNVGTGIAVTSTSTLSGTAAANYSLTQQTGLTANITAIPLTITATGPSKTYGAAITTGTSTTNFTATGAVTGQTVTSVTLTADVNGQTATTPVGTAYVVTPSAPTGTGGFLASNYTITYVNFTGTVTAANLTITATGPSLGFGTGFTNGTYTTNFVSSATAVSGETVTSVTLTSTPALTGTTPVGTAYTITPSAATGTGGFLASNYNITYVIYSDNIRAFLYTWTGAGADNNWTTTANWSSAPGGGTFPQTSNDDVQIGVAAYTGTQQPSLNASEPISSLTFGTNGSTGVTLTINSGNTLTVSSDITVNSGSSTITLANNGAIVVNGAYNNNTSAVLNAASSTGSLSIAGTYNNSGTSTFGAGTVAITGTYNNIGTSTFGAGAVTITGAYTNSGTSTFGSGAVTFSNTFTNSNITTFGTGLVTFNSTAGSTFITTGKPASNAITFYNVAFTGGSNYHFKTTTSAAGIFNLASTGILTLSNSSQVGAANAQFTLLSDANSSATIAAIPAGCQVTGTVNVQRYIQANRAYRLISSPVYSGAVTSGSNTFNDYSLNYVKLTSYLTGTTGIAGGFDKGVNPTLYLYRENLAPLFTTFLNSDYRGINNITSAPNYYLDVDGGPFNIPVGDGFLFFYRGDRSVASLATETVPTYKATAGTLTASGTLNQGNITVTDWYTPGSAGLGYTTISLDPTVEGTNLLGNPYASSIDWDQYISGGIIETNVAPFAYRLIPNGTQSSGNYDVYQAGTNIGGNKQGTQGTANSNIIVSGEGFMVFATGTGASLTFTESAKTNTQVTGASLYMAKRLALSTTNTDQYLRLKLTLDTLSADGTIIRFNANAQANFNPAEDALYKTGTGKVSLSSFSSDNVQLAINQLPLLPGETIRLKVGGPASGNYTLNLADIQGIPQLLDVWLMDAFAGDSVNMRTSNSYGFAITADTGSFGSNRFRLVIKQNPAFIYKLLSFDGQKTGKHQVQLTWNTQNEADYTHFTIERSTDNGKTYDVIGDMISTGAGTYSLVDPEPQKGDNLYYLKTADYFGNITLSTVIDEQFQDNGNDKSSRLSIYPNPATSTINLTIAPKSQGNNSYDIKVSNSSGMVVKYTTISDVNWQNNVSDLLTGTYLIEVIDKKDNTIVGQTKFVKL